LGAEIRTARDERNFASHCATSDWITLFSRNQLLGDPLLGQTLDA